jgi:hypothetical protein
MAKTSFALLVLRACAALVLALIAWACLGYLALMPLGALYGWSGHPALPAAPVAVYIGLYLVVLPVSCLYGAWRVAGVLGRAFA